MSDSDEHVFNRVINCMTRNATVYGWNKSHGCCFSCSKICFNLLNLYASSQVTGTILCTIYAHDVTFSEAKHFITKYFIF